MLFCETETEFKNIIYMNFVLQKVNEEENIKRNIPLLKFNILCDNGTNSNYMRHFSSQRNFHYFLISLLFCVPLVTEHELVFIN